MDWIFVAVVAGSIVTSGHNSEEACLGRKALMEKDQKITGTCIKNPSSGLALIYSGATQTYQRCLTSGGVLVACDQP